MSIFTNLNCFEINLFAREVLSINTITSLTEKPVKRFKTVCGLNPNPEHTKADPFLFVYKDRLFLFYETASYKLGRGVITMVSTKDLHEWTKPKIVLQEPFHLSYPFVFEENGVVFMMPESGEGEQLCLYKATNENLTRFELVKPLLEGRYLDSVLLKRDGNYFLFTSDEPQYRQYVLHLYHSHTLEGPYIEHPSSPICYDTEFSRCGGKIIEFDGKICRVSQDCSSDYGDNVSLISIDCLNTTEYKESLFCRNVFNRACETFKDGGHHLTYVKYKGQYVIATDRKTTRRALRNVFSFLKRFK